MKKKLISLLVLLVAAVSGAWAEEVTIGDGTATAYYTPYNSLWSYSYVQQVYTADEIGMAGTISSIAFCLKESEADQTNEYDIFMKHVTRETFGSTTDFETVTAENLVYSGSITFSPGWTTITLETPFEYDGTQNLMIALHEKTSGYSTRYFYYTSKANSVISFHSDSYNPNPYEIGTYAGSKYTAQNRANIKINIEAAGGYALNAVTEHGTVQFNVGEGESLKENVTTAKEGDKVTVIITPDTGYAVDEVTGKWCAAVAASRRIPAAGTEIGLLSDITLTAGDVDETTGVQTYTFTMERANVQFNVTYKHRHIWDFSVSTDGTQLIATCQNQSGDCDVREEITEIALPEELVYGVDCEAGVDLEAFNAALGGEAEAELVSAVYTGTLLNGGDAYGPTTEVPTLPGEYTVTVTVSAGGQDYVFSRQYTLNQKVIDNLMIQPIADCVYDGQVQSPDVVVKYGDIVLTLGTDYVVRYSENVNAGVGMVAVYGIENYDGVSYGTFNILKKELTADMIEVIADQSYTGQAVEPAVVVKYSDNLVDGRVYVLKPGHDYTVSYENNVEVGTATVIVTAADGNYSGEVKATFNIVGTTGIGAVSGASKTTAKRYDLSGRKAKATKKGIVIIDGKLIMVK